LDLSGKRGDIAATPTRTAGIGAARMGPGSLALDVLPPTPARNPKKRGSLQAVPVMARAMVERLA
jgi:hypothetical protein